MLLKITVEQNGSVLSQSVAKIEEDEGLSVAIKTAIDKARAVDRSKPLWLNLNSMRAILAGSRA